MAALPGRLVRPAIYFALGAARTIGYGLTEAARPPLPCRLTHRVARDSNDLAHFAVTLVKRLAQPGLKGAQIDIVLVDAADVDISRYALVPYLWTEAFNVHIVSDDSELELLRSTLAPDPLEAAAPNATATIGADSIGRVQLPAFFMNQGREFLKTNDWAARYCAISLDATPLPVWIDAFREIERTHPNWYFLPLGLSPFTTGLSGVSLPNVIAPGRSGLGFLGQLSLAMQADAYLGIADIFGAAAVLAGIPCTWLAQEDQLDKIVVADQNLNVRCAPANPSVAEELKGLIDRRQALARIAA